MIDTIKFLIPIEDTALIQRLEGNLTRFRKEDLKTGKIEFEFHNAHIELGTYHRTVAIRSSSNPSGFFVEFSIPKYAKGNNVEMIHAHEISAIMEKVYKDICAYINYQLPHYLTWPIYRLDVCYNWFFKDKDEARYAVDFIKRIDYPRKQKYIWDTSVMYRGSAYTIKFYMKGAEFMKNDFKKVNPDRAPELHAWAQHILRFEVGLRKKYLEEFLGLKTVFLSNISDDTDILESLTYYLQKVFFYINAKTMSNMEITDILFSNFTRSKATRLYQFYKGFYFDEEIKDMFLQGGMNRSTIYRYKTDLKRVGIGFSLSDAPKTQTILEQLVIPSPNSKFDLVDYPLPPL